MNYSSLNIVILGLSITSSWGNGHATTYRSLVKGLWQKKHNITFLERNVPWYESNRDLPVNPFCRTFLYQNLNELKENYSTLIHDADIVIIGSYVPEGVQVGKFILETAEGVKAFYDIDTPITLNKLRNNDFEYLEPFLIKEFDLYLSFTGGPILKELQREYNSPAAKAFYCSFDPDLYFKEESEIKWDLGYLGTFSTDRQPKVNEFIISAAENNPDSKFIIAGPGYPTDIFRIKNIEHIDHLPPPRHRGFYNSQRFTINITREDMVKAGYSPSVRLFEAAACGTPIISDKWKGLEELFEPGKEILIANSRKDIDTYLGLSFEESKLIGKRAQERVLQFHTAYHRASELENYYQEILTKV